MKTFSRVHVCYSQHLNEKGPKKKCRCREKISLTEATQRVRDGFAQWIILGKTIVEGKGICPICENGSLKKGCQSCKGSGEVTTYHEIKTESNNIVAVTSATPEPGRAPVYRPVLALKTPRVATIEKAHIHRAYLGTVAHPNGDPEEQARIDAYGLSILETRIEMGIGVEPPDDPKTATGRKYDWGRASFASVPDSRTSLGTGKIGARIAEGFKMIEGEDGKEE
jgi:hypothetical protein